MEFLTDFPESEYITRQDKAKQLMAKTNIDALLITAGENLRYFCGFTSMTRCRPSFLLLPQRASPTLVVQENNKYNAALFSCVKDIRSYMGLVSSKPGSYIELLIEVFQELGLDKQRVAAELGYEQRMDIPYEDFVRLERESGMSFIDSSEIIWALRMTKSKKEILCLRKACEIMGKAYEKCFSDAKEDMGESDVATLLQIQMMELGADGSGFVVFNSGLRSPGFRKGEQRPHTHALMTGPPTDKKITKGDTLWIDAGCTYKGYWSDFSRMAVVGKPSGSQKRMHRLICDVTEKCVRAVKPGVTASKIVNVCNNELKRKGIGVSFEDGRIGHGVGLLVTEPPHIAPYDTTSLGPGMVITIEPGIVTDYGVFHVEENVLVTKDGYEVLSTANRELRIIN